MFPPGTCFTWTVISLCAQADALFAKHLDGNIQIPLSFPELLWLVDDYARILQSLCGWREQGLPTQTRDPDFHQGSLLSLASLPTEIC